MNDSAAAYWQSTAVGASPVGQVIALYDAILRDLGRANKAIECGQVEQRVGAIDHALVVIGELQGVLDFEHGGEPARNLESFYQVARHMILRGSVQGSRETLQEVSAMFSRLRAAWAQIECKLSTAAAVRLRAPFIEPQMGQTKSERDTNENELTAKKNGGWRA